MGSVDGSSIVHSWGFGVNRPVASHWQRRFAPGGGQKASTGAEKAAWLQGQNLRHGPTREVHRLSSTRLQEVELLKEAMSKATAKDVAARAPVEEPLAVQAGMAQLMPAIPSMRHPFLMQRYEAFAAAALPPTVTSAAHAVPAPNQWAHLHAVGLPAKPSDHTFWVHTLNPTHPYAYHHLKIHADDQTRPHTVSTARPRHQLRMMGPHAEQIAYRG